MIVYLNKIHFLKKLNKIKIELHCSGGNEQQILSQTLDQLTYFCGIEQQLLL